MSRQTSTRFRFLLNLTSSASLPGGSLSYAWLSDGTKVSARADDGSGHGVQKRYFGSFVFTSNAGISTDHLGNVRTVIDITTDMVSPSIMEQNNYLPFGTLLPRTDPVYAFGNRWRYAAKEEQRFGPADLGLLDFGARMYDPFIARWTAVDPMAAKYPGHSPFNYCEGSPINRIDPQGDTIVVLYARNAVGGLGHMAILVQDEHGKYHLWSKNGDKSEGDQYKDNEGDSIDDIQSFLDGINNAPGHKTSDGEPYYTEGYMIATTPEQDAIITKRMEKKIKRFYSFFLSNCAQAVQTSLKKADVQISPIKGFINALVFSSYKPLEHTVPKSTYNSIKQANPGGKIYKPSK